MTDYCPLLLRVVAALEANTFESRTHGADIDPTVSARALWLKTHPLPTTL